MENIEKKAKLHENFEQGAVKSFAERHPLTAYFLFAYLGTWILIIPLLLSGRGLGWIDLPDPLAFLTFFLATYTGPFLSAVLVTRWTMGKSGLRQLLGRILQWRFGIKWYLVILFGYPLIFLAGLSVSLGGLPFSAALQNWPLFFSVYLPSLLIGLFLPALGEETGWRGFALPRLQQRYGPLASSLVLGFLHAMWHFPAYFVRGMILEGPFDLTVFIANSAAMLAATILWTWVFNNARGSILAAMLLHAASNAVAPYLPALFTVPQDTWGTFITLGACALLVIVFTRGRLSYKPEPAQAAQP
jgi:uncharacterized protein